jgi:DNA-binding response OmpR family regulator
VEDNAADVLLIRDAIEAANVEADLHIIHDGEKAIRFLAEVDSNEAATCPALVILDINLPKKHGGEVLARLRKSRSGNASVIVVSTSDSARDREQMAALGANRYFRKPSEYDSFLKLGDIVKELLEDKTPKA